MLEFKHRFCFSIYFFFWGPVLSFKKMFYPFEALSL